MPGSTNITLPISGNFYAINDGYFNDASEATIKSCLRNIMFWIKSATIQADPTLTDVETSNNKSIHWKDVRDQLLPDANNFLDDLFRVKYYTPFNKTLASKTQYSKHLVQMAALYCAWRIEERDYFGGGQVNESDNGKILRTILNERINEVLSGAVRLPGQRLKSTSRFINPHIEEVPAGLKQGLDQVSSTPQSVQTSFRTEQ